MIGSARSRQALCFAAAVLLLLCHAEVAAADDDRPGCGSIASDGHICIHLLDSFEFGQYWSRVGADTSLEIGRKTIFAARVNPGVKFHIWDHNWDPAPRAVFSGWLSASLSSETLLGNVTALYDVTSREIEVGHERSLFEDMITYGADAQFLAAHYFGGRIDRRGDTPVLLAAGVKGRFLQVETVSPFALSRQEYEEELELSLVESRPITRDDLESPLVDTSATLLIDATRNAEDDDVATAGSLTLLRAEYLHFPAGLDAANFFASEDAFVAFAPFGIGGGDTASWIATGNASKSSKSKPRDGWFEVHAVGSVMASAIPDASVGLLPDLGHPDFGLLSARQGTFPNVYAATGGVQVGPSFLRAFAEHGISWGHGDPLEVTGFGGLIALPRGWLSLSERPSAHAQRTSAAILTVGGTLDGQVTLGGRVSGVW